MSNKRKATAIRFFKTYGRGVYKITPRVLADLFRETEYTVKAILDNKQQYDCTWAESEQVRKGARPHIESNPLTAEMLEGHKRMRGWQIEDVFSQFEWNENEWGFPLKLLWEDFALLEVQGAQLDYPFIRSLRG